MICLREALILFVSGPFSFYRKLYFILWLKITSTTWLSKPLIVNHHTSGRRWPESHKSALADSMKSYILTHPDLVLDVPRAVPGGSLRGPRRAVATDWFRPIVMLFATVLISLHYDTHFFAASVASVTLRGVLGRAVRRRPSPPATPPTLMIRISGSLTLWSRDPTRHFSSPTALLNK